MQREREREVGKEEEIKKEENQSFARESVIITTYITI